MIVVDTNVISELMRPDPAATVLTWMEAHDGPELYTTAITVAEVRYGVARLPPGPRRQAFSDVTAGIFAGFAEKILAFDAVAAEVYAEVVSHRDELGMPIDALDAQIASICRACRSSVATRNVADFRDTGIDVVNPWRD